MIHPDLTVRLAAALTEAVGELDAVGNFDGGPALLVDLTPMLALLEDVRRAAVLAGDIAVIDALSP